MWEGITAVIDLDRLERRFRAQPAMHPFRMSAALFFIAMNFFALTAHTVDNPRAFSNIFAVFVWLACGFLMLLAAFTRGYWLPRFAYAGFIPLLLLFVYQFRAFHEALAFLMVCLSLAFVLLSCLHGLIWRRAGCSASRPMPSGLLPQYTLSLIDCTVLGTLALRMMAQTMEGGVYVVALLGVGWLYAGTMVACRFSGKGGRVFAFALMLLGFRGIFGLSPDMGGVCDMILLIHAGMFGVVTLLLRLLRMTWPKARAYFMGSRREGVSSNAA